MVRQKGVKKHSLCGVNEHLEPSLNAACAAFGIIQSFPRYKRIYLHRPMDWVLYGNDFTVHCKTDCDSLLDFAQAREAHDSAQAKSMRDT